MPQLLSTLGALLVAGLVLEAIAILGAFKSIDSLKSRLRATDTLEHGPLAPGDYVPQFELQSTKSDAKITLDAIGRNGGVLLFVSSRCGACKRLAPELAACDPLPASLLVLWRGTQEEWTDLAPSVPAAIATDEHLRLAYGIPGYPAAVAITKDHRVQLWNIPADINGIRRLLSLNETVSERNQVWGGVRAADASAK